MELHWPLLLAMAAGQDVDHPVDSGGAPSFWNLYAPIAGAGEASVFVVAQLGQSLDGRIATPSGHSRYINGPEAIRHLHRLRALVDVVVVGIGTVIADDPRLTVRETEGPNPARVVIDPNFRLPAEACMLADDGSAVFAVQGCDGGRPSAMSAIVIEPRNGMIAPAAIIAALVERGFRRILIEGGASTVSAFLSAGVIDRLHISVAPILIGSGPIGVTLPPIDHMDGAKRPRTSIHRLGQDVLFDCALEPMKNACD
jgi:riboflavin-specific deaminase-like protein